MRTYAVPAAVVGALAVTAAVLVSTTLDRPPVPTFGITRNEPSEAGRALVGPVVHTLDASDPERWIHFDFSRGSSAHGTPDRSWDVAFRRFEVLANGGPGFPGSAGVADLGEVSFEEVTSAPAGGYRGSGGGRDSTLSGVERWYDYSFTSHLLTPKPRVWAVRTADGRYAKLRFLSYYCPGAVPGCVTFEYVYQGDGSRVLSAPASDTVLPRGAPPEDSDPSEGRGSSR